MQKIIASITALIIILAVAFVCLKFYPDILLIGANNPGGEQFGNKTLSDTENFDVKPLPEDKIPVVYIINQTFSNTTLTIEKNWRVRFVNKGNTSYTLTIPDIGIEEELPPQGTTEPTFYKEGNITFWIRELGINATNGTVQVIPTK